MRKIYLLLAVTAVSGLAHAEGNSFLPEAKLTDAKVSTWNVGQVSLKNYYTPIWSG